MEFAHNARSLELQEQVKQFLDDFVYPAEPIFEEQRVRRAARLAALCRRGDESPNSSRSAAGGLCDDRAH